MSKRLKSVGAVALLIVLGVVVEGVPSSAGAQSQAAVDRVIVVLRNQESALPATRRDIAARRSAVQQTQAPVVRDLASSGATNVHALTLINAVTATVSDTEEAQLKANPAVREVVPDQIIRLAPPDFLANRAGSGNAATSSGSAANLCPAPGKVQLNPQALELIHAESDDPSASTARRLGIDGSGVVVGLIADGLDPNNPDLIRPNGQHVVTDYKDFSGDGTGAPTGGEEAFGDAASIAAQGNKVYNVAGFGPHAVKTPCDIRIEGVAPGASVVALSVFGEDDEAGFNSSVLQAINYAVTADHVNVLNESLGNNYYPDLGASLDLIKAANDAAIGAGTTVVTSSGDAGVTNTIATPATDPGVIATGATTSYRIDLQDGYGGAQFPGITGYLNNNTSSFSSAGFEQTGHTIDVVAPGEDNWSLCSKDVAIYQDCTNYNGQPTNFLPFGGTSESAPLTSGTAALVYQAYDKTHGTYPTPQVTKQIITSTADDIGSPADQEGAGLIDAVQAVRAAESYQAPASTPPPAGNTVLHNPSQFNVVEQPNKPQTLTATVTNNGSAKQTIAVSSRTFGRYAQIADQTVTLSDTTSPHTTAWDGTPSNYEKVAFTVPKGEDRLNASLAFQNVSPTDLAARVRLTLVDPSGRLAAYSVPQGDGNYGNVQVTEPQAGVWTAYVWSRESTYGGTTGPVLFGAQVAQYAPFGHVSPSRLTLAPGQSAPVTLSESTPATPGDSAGSILLTSSTGPSFARTTTIPVTMRSLIPNGPTTFTQTLTGGNGRSLITGQTFDYQFDVPAGAPELNASVTLANNPNNPFTMFLIDPSGDAVAQGANLLTSASTFQSTNLLGAQVRALSPAPGAWTLIVAYIPQVSGTALSEPFTVSTSENAVPASAAGLPDSLATTLAAGKPQTVQVRVKNPSAAPAAYFVDGRLAGSTTLPLTSLTDPTTTVPLSILNNFPEYVIPTNSTAMSATASTTGSTPIMFDSAGPAGDPDIGSTVGNSVVGSFRANPISQGLWDIAPDVVGAFGPAPAPNEPVTTSMSVTTQPFDPAVSASTGDMWLASVDPTVLGSLSPVIIGPGQTGTIPVTITPKGPAGATVSGTLYVDTEDLVTFANFLSPNGSQVAAIPYRYTIAK